MLKKRSVRRTLTVNIRESEDRVKRGQCALTHRINSMCANPKNPVLEVADSDNKVKPMESK